MVRQVDAREINGAAPKPHRHRRRTWLRLISPVGRADVRNPGTYHTNGSSDDTRDDYHGEGVRDDV